MTRGAKIAAGSIAVAALVLLLKLMAYWLTGSLALLSDAMESIVNIATALAAFLAIRIAEKPADENHPFGHSKAELFSALFEGLMILLAALLILKEAFDGLQAPYVIELPLLGILATALATLLNAAWARFLIVQGRRENSPALVADGHHLSVDVLTSVGVAAGVVITWVTGWHMLDVLIAVAIALHVLWAGAGVLRQALSGLMDESLPEEMLEAIRDIIRQEGKGAVEAHDLRSRQAGRASFVEFHLVVPGEMTVQVSHDICDRLERAIRAQFGELQVTIHVEPEHKCKAAGAIMVE